MHLSKTSKIAILTAWVILSMCYYTIYFGNYTDDAKYYQYYYNFSDDENFLIYTPGCKIPNYLKTIKINEYKSAKKTCGQRAVYVNKYSDDEVEFVIDDNRIRSNIGAIRNSSYYCCFKFISPGKSGGKIDYSKQRYSTCINFKNGTITQLEEEVITVTCFKKATKKLNMFYEDSYMILKKLTTPPLSEQNNRWNILLVGMDTMSRARVSISMPKTMNYLKSQNWLDFRGYTKVGSNTFPNIAAFLSGKDLPAVNRACASGLDKCNEIFIWSDFQSAGYTTAYGEDFVRLPDTFTRFNGFKNKPTDHYMRPLFLTSERNLGDIVCTKTLTSSQHVFDYASEFSRTYQNESFYGLFWLNSYSHNSRNNPTLLEDDLINFFHSLEDTGVMENTFIFFLSDHGIRFGEMRVTYEMYYDERLPMLFLWVPEKFKQLHKAEYENLQNNQNRLVSPYDLYLTMWDIHRTSDESAEIKKSEACPKCRSLISNISPHRVCMDAGVSDKWCSCHEMNAADLKETNVKRSIRALVEYLHNKSKAIETIKCTECAILQPKTVYHVHTYSYNNVTHYVIALVMKPGDIAFETTLVENGDAITILQPTYTITAYNTRGECVTKPNDRAYCVCKKTKCKNNHSN